MQGGEEVGNRVRRTMGIIGLEQVESGDGRGNQRV